MASRSTEPLGSNSEDPYTASVTTPTLPSTATPASSRKRTWPTVIADEMEINDLAGAGRAKKSKKAISAQFAAQDVALASVGALAGPSSNAVRKAYAQSATQVTVPPVGISRIGLAETTTISAIDDREGPADITQVELHRLHREIAQLKAQLGFQVKNQEAAKLQTVQSMMLDRIREQKDGNERLEKLRRQRYYAAQYAKQQEAECEKQKKRVDESNKKHAKTLAELKYYKEETEHLQSLNKAMEEDLDELRRIDNEDRVQRVHNKHDLPPAYGSLDDEDPSTLPLLHQDSGSFEFAALKRTVRISFSLKLREAQRTADALRSSSAEASSADAVIFLQLSSALADSSRVLRAALDRAENLHITTITAEGLDPTSESSRKVTDSDEMHHIVRRSSARHGFVADRVAKMLLTLVWRTISATELRPLTLTLSSRDRAMLCLAYKELDDCFHEALRHTFLLNESEGSSNGQLWEYQYYLTQISALRRSFNNLGACLSYALFTKSWEWLSEKAEHQRMSCANEQPQPGMCTLAAIIREQPAGSEVSSEMSSTESNTDDSAP